MILVYDTETTGKANFKQPASHPSQPFIVQLAGVLYDEDGNEVEAFNALARPNGWTIPPEVTKIHGITMDKVITDGQPLPDIISRFAKLAVRAHTLVAHNIQFDDLMWAAEMHRLAGPDPLAHLKRYCTMEQTTPLCKLRSPWGHGFKWPKLIEAHQHFFNEGFEGAHDALADVRACARIYFHLNKKQ